MLREGAEVEFSSKALNGAWNVQPATPEGHVSFLGFEGLKLNGDGTWSGGCRGGASELLICGLSSSCVSSCCSTWVFETCMILFELCIKRALSLFDFDNW